MSCFFAGLQAKFGIEAGAAEGETERAAAVPELANKGGAGMGARKANAPQRGKDVVCEEELLNAFSK
jgi:hypothetical protein